MAEYINRYEVLVKLQGKLYNTLSAAKYDEITKIIRDIPTADVGEVVRCKNCIYSRKSGSKWCCRRAAKNGVIFPTNPSNFCASGKRKEQI